MKDYSEEAERNFYNGYNCAQSVFLAYAKDYGIEEKEALKLSSSFGGGMGRLREVCGAVTAMFAIAGLEYGYIERDNDEKKCKHYELIQRMAKKFKERHKTIICRELLDIEEEEISPIPSKRDAEYYESRPCKEYIKTACKILSEI